MKTNKKLSNMLFLLGIILSVMAMLVAFSAKDAGARMVQHPNDALKRVDQMMTRICAGDYRGASAMMYGQPSLGSAPEGSSLAVELLWAAYLDSLDYTVSGKCYPAENGVAVDVSVRMMDTAAVISSMEGHTKALLGSCVASAKDMSEIYDEDNNFRQEVMDAILRDAVVQALSEDQAKKEEKLTLNLVYDRGEWWIMPDAGLQYILSGAF